MLRFALALGVLAAAVQEIDPYDQSKVPLEVEIERIRPIDPLAHRARHAGKARGNDGVVGAGVAERTGDTHRVTPTDIERIVGIEVGG